MRHDADGAVVLGVDVELLPFGRVHVRRRIGVPRPLRGFGVQPMVGLHRRDHGLGACIAQHGDGALAELRAQFADRVEVGERTTLFVQEQARHLVDGPQHADAELLLLGGRERPVHERAE